MVKKKIYELILVQITLVDILTLWNQGFFFYFMNFLTLTHVD